MFKRAFVGFLVFVFVLFALPFVLIFGFREVVFDSDFYHEKLAESLRAFLIEDIVSGVEYEKFKMNHDDAVVFFESIILKEDIGAVFDDLYVQLDSVAVSSGQFQLKLPLSWVKDKTDLIASKLYDHLAAKLPVCDLDKEVDFEFKCLPDKIPEKDMVAVIKRELDLQNFSSSFSDLVFSFEVPMGLSGSPISIVKTFFNYAIWGIFAFLAVLIFIILLLSLDSIYRVLKNMSLAIFSSSITALVSLLFFTNFVDLKSFDFRDVDAKFLPLILDLVNSFVNLLVEKVYIVLIISAVVSLGLAIFSFIKLKSLNESS